MVTHMQIHMFIHTSAGCKKYNCPGPGIVEIRADCRSGSHPDVQAQTETTAIRKPRARPAVSDPLQSDRPAGPGELMVLFYNRQVPQGSSAKLDARGKQGCFMQIRSDRR